MTMVMVAPARARQLQGAAPVRGPLRSGPAAQGVQGHAWSHRARRPWCHGQTACPRSGAVGPRFPTGPVWHHALALRRRDGALRRRNVALRRRDGALRRRNSFRRSIRANSAEHCADPLRLRICQDCLARRDLHPWRRPDRHAGLGQQWAGALRKQPCPCLVQRSPRRRRLGVLMQGDRMSHFAPYWERGLPFRVASRLTVGGLGRPRSFAQGSYGWPALGSSVRRLAAGSPLILSPRREGSSRVFAPQTTQRWGAERVLLHWCLPHPDH